MRIEIRQPHPDYPFAWALVQKPSIVTDEFPESYGRVSDLLRDKGITVLGIWEHYDLGPAGTRFMKAPVLLEYEHTKPKKKRAAK